MGNTQFILDNSCSEGTSNLSYLLDPEIESLLRTFTPAMVTEQFGQGDTDCFEFSKGYSDPEWYWQSSDGSIWGIGWRWGTPRLRGRGSMKKCSGPFWVHPTREQASEFVRFLVRSVKRTKE